MCRKRRIYVKFRPKAHENEIDNVQWIKKNIITDNIEEKADLVISSYVLNEIKSENRNQILEKLWNSTGKLLLIIEPGTPEGYNQIKEIRDYFIKKGANIVAPCAHEKECKISKMIGVLSHAESQERKCINY